MNNTETTRTLADISLQLLYTFLCYCTYFKNKKNKNKTFAELTFLLPADLDEYELPRATFSRICFMSRMIIVTVIRFSCIFQQ